LFGAHKAALGVLAEVILGIILTKAWDQVYAWYMGSLAQNSVVYGIAGLILIIIFVMIGILLILFYLRKLNIKYKETSINIYNRRSGIKLDEFLNKANLEYIFSV
jgi:uncharacterized BrkB/YihY/UPF0761 family membrane protein